MIQVTASWVEDHVTAPVWLFLRHHFLNVSLNCHQLQIFLMLSLLYYPNSCITNIFFDLPYKFQILCITNIYIKSHPFPGKTNCLSEAAPNGRMPFTEVVGVVASRSHTFCTFKTRLISSLPQICRSLTRRLERTTFCWRPGKHLIIWDLLSHSGTQNI